MTAEDACALDASVLATGTSVLVTSTSVLACTLASWLAPIQGFEYLVSSYQ